MQSMQSIEKTFRKHLRDKFPSLQFVMWQEPPHIVKAFRTDGNPPPQFGGAAILVSKTQTKAPPTDKTNRRRNTNKCFVSRISLVGKRIKSSTPRVTNGSWVDKRPESEIVKRYARKISRIGKNGGAYTKR